VFRHFLQRFVRARGRDHLVAVLMQILHHEIAGSFLVVDDQDF
jgi:hypothetical protein